MGRSSTLKWHDRELLNKVSKQVASGVRAGAKHLRAELRNELSGPSPSREGGAPGDAPGSAADDDLRRSIKFKVRRTRTKVDAVVGALDPEQAAKGARLASGFVGTDRDGRTFSQAPRPWLGPVYEREKDRIAALIVAGADTGGDEG